MREVGCLHAAVSQILRRNSLNRSTCNRKKNTNARNEWKLLRILKKKRRLANILQRYSRGGMSLAFRFLFPPAAGDGLQEQSICHQAASWRKRRQWAREHQDWDAAQRFRVVFSDESKFFCISFNQGAEFGDIQGSRTTLVALSTVSNYLCKPCLRWELGASAFFAPLWILLFTREVSEHLLIPSAEQLFGDDDYIF